MSNTEKMLENATESELVQLAELMQKAAKLIGTSELKKAIIKKIEKRLEVLERLPAVRKSVIAQDDDAPQKLWPSL